MNKVKKLGAKFGHPVSQETREKLRKANLGKKQSEETIIKRGLRKKGKDHHCWKGNKAGYTAIHRWIIEHKGMPQKCENPECQYPRKDARGKLMKKPSKFEWANIDHKYRRVLSDYIRLCTPCHRRFDMVRTTK